MVGPRVSITVPASGRVLVMLAATFEHGGNGAGAYMGFESTGGSGNVVPADTRAVYFALKTADTGALTLSGMFPVAGLSAGEHTFTVKYKTTGSAGTGFHNRYMTVIPLP